MKAGKVRSRTGIIFIDTVKQEPAQRFGSANKPFLPHTISAGCVGYTVHPILIRAYFVLITQSQYLPTCVFLLYCALVCCCICLTHVRPTCFYPEEPMAFGDLCNDPGILWKSHGVCYQGTPRCVAAHLDVFFFSHPREAAGAPIPVPTVHHRALTPHPLFIHTLVPLRLSKIFMR